MQTLWTRVAQASCRCPQCLASAPGAVARRATTAAGRRPQYWTSSTLWYSGIFAAAATLDAKQKIQRREKWDQAIADIQQELGQDEEQKAEQVVEQEVLREESREASQASSHTTEHENASAQYIFEGEDALRALEANLDSSTSRRRQPMWPTNTGPPLDKGFLPPQSIYASRRSKAQASTTRLHAHKMECIMNRMDRLQLHIIFLLMTRGMQAEAVKSVPPEYGQFIQNSTVHDINHHIAMKDQDYDRLMKMPDIHILNDQPFERSHGDMRLCSYQQDDMGQFHQTTREMNYSLGRLFRRSQDGSLSLPGLLANIAHHLHSTDAPPNIDTFNTLLVGFFNAGEHYLFKRTVQVMKGSHMRPNEVTLTAVLQYNTAIGDEEHFLHWLHLMRGSAKVKRSWGEEYDKKLSRMGLMLATPDVNINDFNHTRFARDEKSGNVIQRPYATPMVFGAIVKGVLEFSGFETALKVAEAMAQEGWSLCMNGLGPLIRDCAERRDWNAGSALWKHVSTLQALSRQRRDIGPSGESLAIPTYASMLRLCRRCGKRDEFDVVLDAARKTHPGAEKRIMELAISGGDKNDKISLRACFHAADHAAPTSGSKTRRKRQSMNGGNYIVFPESLDRPSINPPDSHLTANDHPDDSNQISQSVANEQSTAESIATTLEVVEDDRHPHAEVPAHRKVQRRRPSVQPEENADVVLTEEQLRGTLPGSDELNDYEDRERPLKMAN